MGEPLGRMVVMVVVVMGATAAGGVMAVVMRATAGGLMVVVMWATAGGIRLKGCGYGGTGDGARVRVEQGKRVGGVRRGVVGVGGRVG
jgi:hypothetical protein